MRYATLLLLVLAGPLDGQGVVSVAEFRSAPAEAKEWYLAGFIDATAASVPWACVEEWRAELVDAIEAYVTLYVPDFTVPMSSVIPDALATVCHQFTTDPTPYPAPPPTR